MNITIILIVHPNILFNRQNSLSSLNLALLFITTFTAQMNELIQLL
jgi:hypothetical protein